MASAQGEKSLPLPHAIAAAAACQVIIRILNPAEGFTLNTPLAEAAA